MPSTPNPYLKQLLTEIASKATVGRNNLSWKTLEESRKKKKKAIALKEVEDEKDEKDKEPEATSLEPKPAKDNAAPIDKSSDIGVDSNKESPPGGKPSAPAPEAPAEAPEEKAPEEAPGEEVDKAKEDALSAQAELEKAKAEKSDAEKELDNQSYIHLISSGGVSFLLGKLVDHAFKTNTIDALATEMVDKLKVKTQDEFKLLSDEMIPFKNIPGVADLLSSMGGIVGKQQPPAEEPVAESDFKLVNKETEKEIREGDEIENVGIVTKIDPPTTGNSFGDIQVEDYEGMTRDGLDATDIMCEWAMR
jgi:hypothetical protein